MEAGYGLHQEQKILFFGSLKIKEGHMPTRRKIHRAFIASALSCALVTGGTASALAARVYVDGGTWDYGTNSSHVWSNYHHPSVRHATSAHGKFTAQSGCKGANQWANASAPQRPGVADQSYYRFC
ncbi:lactococcin 972 family bacteriocin [Corynebacterium mastitidis]|uniref:lactococcin 972 family bacteriocin n=1 Tax=Corynebacterium mastitidis TaxID=161890 RepID=UPI0030EA4A26